MYVELHFILNERKDIIMYKSVMCVYNLNSINYLQLSLFIGQKWWIDHKRRE